MRVIGNQLGGGVNRPITSITEFTSVLASLVDGIAFVYSDVDLSSYAGTQKLTLIDSSGKKAVGFTGSIGSGLTLGEELLSNGDFESGGTDWVVGEGDRAWTFSDGKAYAPVDTYKNLDQLSIFSTGLFQLVVDMDAEGGDGIQLGPTAKVTVFTESATKYFSYISPNSSFRAQNKSADTGYLESLSVKQVTEPPATGLLIVSTRGGSTRNWANIESGFDPNDIAEIELEG